MSTTPYKSEFSPEPVTKHFPCLNGFRAIAVIAVILHHTAYFFGLNSLPIHPLILKFASLGFLGVDFFFVISGFLISGILLDELTTSGSICISRFYLRRSFKIIPQYLTVLIAGSLLFSITTERSFPYYFIFLQNYVPPIQPLMHLWSIAVEEHFYLFLPALLAAISHIFRKHTIKIYACAFIALIITGNVLRLVLWNNATPSSVLHNPSFFQMTHLRFDALLFGCLLRILYRRPLYQQLFSIPVARNVFFMLGLLSYSFFFIFNFNTICWWHYTLAYFASGCLILSALGGCQTLRILTELPALDFIGRSSYGIYLWHYILVLPFAIYYQQFFHSLILVLVYIVLTFTIGILSTYTIEKYFLNLRKHLMPAV